MRFEFPVMTKYIVLFLILILWIQPGQSGWAQPKNSSDNLDEMISEILDDTYNYKFDDAIKATDKIIRILPDEPEGYLYKCGVCWKMLEEGCDEPVDSTKREIKFLIDKACALAAGKINSNPNDVMAHFYYAGSLVYLARYEAMSHDWFAVMSDGSKAKKMLEKDIEIDPHFYDAYSGIGAFNYYAARIPWYLKPIAFVLGISGNEDEGIAELKEAAQFGKYSKIEAAVFLASVVCVNEEDYSSAVKLMANLHRQYPDNLDFVKNLCHDDYEMQNYEEVVDLANSALEMDNAIGLCHRNTLSLIRFYRGESYEKLDDKNKAIADYESVVKLNGNGYSGKEAQEALDKLRSQ
ncbi:MAG: tetratricopeptide repeat protein [Candidatus Kryptoniota bacterium]